MTSIWIVAHMHTVSRRIRSPPPPGPSRTSMSNSALPPEILDYILDLLHNDPESLKQCSLVAKSWVPRTRRYLFAYISFYARILQSWSHTFPDPTNSPALHVRTIEVNCRPRDLKGADWFRSFSSVVNLILIGPSSLPFTSFHGFSHNLKSLKICFIRFLCSELLRLICSFPLLESLDLVSEEVLEDDANDFHGLQTSPPLTGSLKLIVLNGGMRRIPRYLLNLPNGLRFRELVLLLVTEDDVQWLNELVLRCSDTLEYLDIKSEHSTPNLIDLSQLTKLKVLKVRFTTLSLGRVIAMLDTITAEHRDFRQISIYLPFRRIPHDALRFRFGDGIYEKWLGLDRLLVKFWESQSIRTKVVLTSGNEEIRIGPLLPEMTARGIVDVVYK